MNKPIDKLVLLRAVLLTAMINILITLFLWYMIIYGFEFTFTIERIVIGNIIALIIGTSFFYNQFSTSKDINRLEDKVSEFKNIIEEIKKARESK